MPLTVLQFSAVPDGRTLTTTQLQSAIDACGAAGGGTLLVPAGRYVTGTLWMRSNVTLHLDEGAVLLGSDRVDDFPICGSEWEGPGVKPGRASMICGERLKNVAITGRGTIDGRGQ